MEKDVIPKTQLEVFIISSLPRTGEFILNSELNEACNEFKMTLNSKSTTQNPVSIVSMSSQQTNIQGSTGKDE